VLAQAGTEKSGSSECLTNNKRGIYYVRLLALSFKATTKFDSGTGWPSFEPGKIKEMLHLSDFTIGLIARKKEHCSPVGGT